MNLEKFISLIKNSNFIPVERYSLYNELKVWYIFFEFFNFNLDKSYIIIKIDYFFTYLF